MKTAVFTICARNYMAYALTLQASLRRFEPDLPFFIYLSDEAPDSAMAPDASIIPADDLGLPDLASMAFRYSVMEFSTAIKADCFLDLFLKKGFERAIYLDPDICLYAPLSEVSEALEAGASLVLTPHILTPLPEGVIPSEAEIVRSGVFNLGFAAFSRSDESLGFLRWWARRLHESCYSAPEDGLFVDQKFVDMAPAFVSRLTVLRHPGYNLAYWNLPNRKIECRADSLAVNGAPLVFFHFSGVIPGRPNVLSKHTRGRGAPAPPEIVALVEAYLKALDDNGHGAWSRSPYAFAAFGNGMPILPPMRRSPPAGGLRTWPDAPDLEYWLAPDPAVDQEKNAALTRLMTGFHEMRPDLKAAFLLSSRAGRLGLYDWFMRHGVKEYAVPAALIEPARLTFGFASTVNRLRRWLAARLAG